MHKTPGQNSQREGRSLPRQGRGPLFQWDVGISVGFFTETTGSLRNPETRRNPSYTYMKEYIGLLIGACGSATIRKLRTTLLGKAPRKKCYDSVNPNPGGVSVSILAAV